MSGHDANCARRLRANLLADAGDPAEPPHFVAETIAAEIVRCCGHRPLKSYRLAYGWTVERAVAAFHAMCREHELGARGLTERSWLEWEAGEHPNADYQDLLCRLFRTDPVSLGLSNAYAERMAPPGLGQDAKPPGRIAALVNGAARESVNHVAGAELTDAGPTALETFEADVGRLARAYPHQAPLPLFAELARLRQEACELLDRRLRPAQRLRMLLVAGQVCGLLANASLDLGSHHAAAVQVRAAWTYALATCDDELRAWVRGLQAMVAYWSHDHRSAIGFARDGQRFASSATARARLYSIEALACATTSAPAEALTALRSAERAEHSGHGADDVHDLIGGELGFTPAKRSYLAGSTYIHLGCAWQAITSAQTAIRLYQSGLQAERSYGNEALARIDLVSGYLLADDLDAACESAAGIFELPHDQRIDCLSRRLTDVGGLLGSARYQRSHQALELTERISDFQAARRLPSGRRDPLRLLP